MQAAQLWVTAPYEVTLQALELPSAPPEGHVLIENERSLISTGTELALVMGTHIGFTSGAAWPRYPLAPGYTAAGRVLQLGAGVSGLAPGDRVLTDTCLLYTSDAADDLLCVDLGGRRIIKKKKIRT